MTYLVRRVGSDSYYYRESVPAEIRSILERGNAKSPREVWRSLRTADRRIAERRLIDVRAAQHAAWDRARRSVAPRQVPTMLEIDDAITADIEDKSVERLLKDGRDWIAQGGSVTSLIDDYNERLGLVSLDLHVPTKEVAEKATRWLIEHHNWDLSDDRDGASNVAAVQAKVLAALQIGRKRAISKLQGHGHDTKSTSRTHGAANSASAMELFERYAEEMRRSGRKGDATLVQDERIVRCFYESVASSKATADIDISDFRAFKEILVQLPKNHSNARATRDMSMAKAAEYARDRGLDRRSLRTVAKELSALSAFQNWLVREGHADHNPVPSLMPQVTAAQKAAQKLPTYSHEQLQRVFSTPLFHSCRGAGGESKVGNVAVRDWRYWIPICALYSGARAGEIAQLHTEDIRQVSGIWVFDFNEDSAAGDKSLKNSKSKRIVPIHSDLISLGILDLANPSRAGETLFEGLSLGPNNRWSDYPSKFWGRYLERINEKKDGLGLHSFRHTFTDECRKYAPDNVIAFLLGHADQSMTAHYGSTTHNPVEEWKELVEKLSFESAFEALTHR